MASFTSIPQFLAPRGIPASSARTLTLRSSNAGRQRQRLETAVRQQSSGFSTTSPNSAKAKKPSAGKQKQQQQQSSSPVLEKPDKFRPPSHPARRVILPGAKSKSAVPPPPKNYPGPPRSKEEIEASNKKWYPNTFPPEGTVMHRFLTSRGIHIWISMVQLPS